jgi:hypothetical protein
MTIVIGYKSMNGEVLLAPDARVSLANGARADVLQKICTYSSNVAIAFTTSDVAWLRNLLTLLHAEWSFKGTNESPARMAHRKADSLRRFLRRRANWPHGTEVAELLIVLNGGNNAGARLFNCSMSKRAVDIKEIGVGQLRICGSGTREPGYDELELRLRKTLRHADGRSGTRELNALVNAEYARVQQTHGTKWKSIGETIYGLYTDRGDFMMPQIESYSCTGHGITTNVGFDYEERTGRYIQINYSSGKKLALFPLNDYRSDPRTRIFSKLSRTLL